MENYIHTRIYSKWVPGNLVYRLPEVINAQTHWRQQIFPNQILYDSKDEQRWKKRKHVYEVEEKMCAKEHKKMMIKRINEKRVGWTSVENIFSSFALFLNEWWTLVNWWQRMRRIIYIYTFSFDYDFFYCGVCVSVIRTETENKASCSHFKRLVIIFRFFVILFARIWLNETSVNAAKRNIFR